MSNFNFNWIKENLSEDATIFYIGAAGLNEVIQLRKYFPKTTIHAFEPSNHWISRYPIFDIALDHNINYHQAAVSDIAGEVSFYPCEKYGEQTWPVSSSIFKPTDSLDFLSFSEPITVQSIRLDTFCEQHDVYPDFIHVDAQGAEYSIFSAMGSHRPKFIWTEICEFDRYDTGVTYNQYYDLLISMGYEKIISDGPDELYVLHGTTVTEYVTKKESDTNIKQFFQKMAEKNNLLNFVYKSKNHVSYKNIHCYVNYNSFEHMLQQLGKINKVYYSDNLPEDKFVYEFINHTGLETNDFFGENGFNELDPIPDNVMQRIREKTAFLMITVPFESPLHPHRMPNIHKYFKKLNLPSSQVIYLSACLNSKEIYKEYCNSIGEDPACIMEYNFSENLVVHSQLAERFKNTEYKSNKKKTFLMFNRRWLSHPHRTLFLYNLYKMNMLNDFHISFNKTDVDHPQYTYTDAVKMHYPNFFKTTEKLDESLLDSLEDLLPLFLDTNDLVSGSLMFDEFDSTGSFYEESFINIIAETYFYTSTANILHLTEKTFKPILYKQPFIMLGPPGMLKKLRELGFKTFHDVWDESYDDTLDHTERFYKVLDLCEKIRQWPQTRKVLAMQECKNIVEHNFNFLLNYKHNPTLLLDFIKRHKLSPYDE